MQDIESDPDLDFRQVDVEDETCPEGGYKVRPKQGQIKRWRYVCNEAQPLPIACPSCPETKKVASKTELMIGGLPATGRVVNVKNQPYMCYQNSKGIMMKRSTDEPKMGLKRGDPANDFLANGWTLQTGEFIRSPNGEYYVSQRNNGNVCLSRRGNSPQSGSPTTNPGMDIWCSLQTVPPRAVGYTDFFTVVWFGVVMTFRGKPTGAYLRDSVPIWASFGIGTNETALDRTHQVLLELFQAEGGFPQGNNRTWLRVYDNGNFCVTVGPNHIDSRPISCQPFPALSRGRTNVMTPFGPIRLPF